MKFSLITCVGVLCLATTPVFAGGTVTVVGGGTTQYSILYCGAGFNQIDVSGSPTGQSYSYTCQTPVIGCVNPPKGLTGGFGAPTAKAVMKGGQFSYTCSYGTPVMPK